MTASYIKTTRVPMGADGAYVEYHESHYGGDTPASDRAKGILRENTYVATYSTVWNGPVSQYLSYASPNYPGHMIGIGASFPLVVPPQPSNIKAYANLLEKFKQSDFNLAVTAAESRESWHMISDRMFSIANAARQVKRGNLKGALRALGSTRNPSRRAQRKLNSGDASGAFLEMQYGWVPLLNDIYSAAELVNKPRVSRPTIRTSDRTDAPLPSVSSGYQQYQPYVWQTQGERVIYHICRLSTTEISMAARMGLTDPLTVLWELVPYSFVVDWFAPIGDLISANQAVYTLPIGTYIRTDVQRWTAGITLPVGVQTNLPYFPGRKTSSTGLYWKKRTEMTRNIYPSLPNQIYTGHGPKQHVVSLDLTLQRAANAGALLHQGLRSLMRR